MNQADKIYLDYNATTPLEPEVLRAIHDALKDAWGNPSSCYAAGVRAKELISEARQNIARMIGAKASDILFTSGGTEANNQILRSALKYYRKHWSGASAEDLPHFISTHLEHDSVKEVLRHFTEEKLATVTYVGAERDGRVTVDDVMAAVRRDTCMITIMLANNETGIIQPISEIARALRVRERTHPSSHSILLHTDAAQALGKVPVNVHDLGVHYLTVVGHKFYGPRIGAIYSSPEVPVYPMLFGGGQEGNIRSGTENTGMIAGLGKAAQMVTENISDYQKHMQCVRDHLETRLTETFGEETVHFNGKHDGVDRIPNTCNVSIVRPGLTGQAILSRCKRLQASVGAACHSHVENRPSAILLASGVDPKVAVSALRLSVGRHTTISDIDTIVEDIRQAVDSIKH